MKSTLTLFWRLLLSACLLPLVTHAQDASRQAPTPAPVVANICPTCPVPNCAITLVASQSEGSWSAPLGSGGQVCSFNWANFGAYSDGDYTPLDNVVKWTTSVTVGSTTTTWATVTKQPWEAYTFQVNQPGWSGSPVTYSVYCETVCPNGRSTWKTFTFYGIQRATSGCGQPIRPAASAPTLELYPSPATEQLAVALDGGSQAVVLNGSGKEVKHITLREGKADVSVADLPRGLYLLRVTSANGKVVDKRFSVEH